MKKFFTVFFITLGVIFSIIILIVIYLFIADPFKIKPLLFGSPAKTQSVTNSDTTSNTNSGLSDTQKKALEAVGVNPATLPSPSSITPAQEACFTEKLGATRVAEIKAGASPTATEIFTAKTCL
jgi:hypothetical protein